jgi:hypothetical protein
VDLAVKRMELVSVLPVKRSLVARTAACHGVLSSLQSSARKSQHIFQTSIHLELSLICNIVSSTSLLRCSMKLRTSSITTRTETLACLDPRRTEDRTTRRSDQMRECSLLHRKLYSTHRGRQNYIMSISTMLYFHTSLTVNSPDCPISRA